MGRMVGENVIISYLSFVVLETLQNSLIKILEDLAVHYTMWTGYYSSSSDPDL